MKYTRLITSFFNLRSNNKKSHDKLQRIKDKKLKELLLYAFEHSDYYRESFIKAGIKKEDIDKLPITSFPTIDKKQFINNFDSLITVKEIKQENLRAFDKLDLSLQNKFNEKYHLVHSSGSTGTPCFFVYDEDAWNQMLIGIIRAALWDMSSLQIIKLLMSKPKVAYLAATDGRYGGAMAVGSGIEGLQMEQLFLDIKTPLIQWIEKINEFKPNIIIGYPSAIKILGELIEAKQISVDITRVISCGEPLGHSLRNYLESVFQADIINIYGASESLALGVESSSSQGMYLFDDLNYIEVIDGEMYLTSLYNFVQPIIRYKISDKLELKENDKNDRYPFSKVESIIGRNEDLLWFEDIKGNKEFLHPLAIEGFCIEGLVDYQFIQTSNKSFKMLAEVPEKRKRHSIENEMNKNLRTILSEKKLDYVELNVEFTDSIPVNPMTGKKKLILSEIG